MKYMTLKEMNLRKILFWDVDEQEIDVEKSADFIIGRVLDYGNKAEWKTVRDFYGEERIKETAQKHIFHNSRSANFWANILKISLEDLKCTKNPLLKTPNAFLKR
jgi:hypothetical protein